MNKKAISSFIIGVIFLFNHLDSMAMIKVPRPSEHKYKKIELKGECSKVYFFKPDRPFKIGLKNLCPNQILYLDILDVDNRSLAILENSTINTRYKSVDIPRISSSTFPGAGHTYKIKMYFNKNRIGDGEAIIFAADQEVPRDYDKRYLAEELFL